MTPLGEQHEEQRRYSLVSAHWGLRMYFLSTLLLFSVFTVALGLGRCVYHDTAPGETFTIVLFALTTMGVALLPVSLPILVGIAAKVNEGATYYEAMVRVLTFVLPINLGQAIIVTYAIAFTPPDLVDYPLLGPGLPLQLLWINLVITVPLAWPLVYEPARETLLRRLRAMPQGPILPPLVIQRTVTTALVLAASVAILANWDFHHLIQAGHSRLEASQHAQTLSLTIVALFQMFYVFHCRSLTQNLFGAGLSSNLRMFAGIAAALALHGVLLCKPCMRRTLGVSPMDACDLGWSVLGACVIFPVIMIGKWLRARLALAEVAEHDDRLGERSSLSHDFSALLETANGSPMTIGAILDVLEIRGHALLLVFFSFPLCLPVGIPILTTLLGPLLAFISFFLILGKRPWLPKRLRNRALTYESLERLVNRLMPMALRVEKRLHYRLLFLTEEGPVVRFHAAYMCLLSLVVSIPLPILFLNLVAALPILLLSLGMLKRDGLFVILAYVAVIPCILMYGGLVVAGVEGVQHMMGILGLGGG